jgi:tetratricopeptide (TPR) repeat protein
LRNRLGDVLVLQGNLPEALTAYKASLAIDDKLAKADPSNAEWQSDLAASHGRLGQLLVRMGSRAEALEMFHKGRAIVVPLVTAAPDHAQFKASLANFDREIAALEQK